MALCGKRMVINMPSCGNREVIHVMSVRLDHNRLATRHQAAFYSPNRDRLKQDSMPRGQQTAGRCRQSYSSAEDHLRLFHGRRFSAYITTSMDMVAQKGVGEAILVMYLAGQRCYTFVPWPHQVAWRSMWADTEGGILGVLHEDPTADACARRSRCEEVNVLRRGAPCRREDMWSKDGSQDVSCRW